MLVIDLVDLPAVPSAFDEPRRQLRPAIRFLVSSPPTSLCLPSPTTESTWSTSPPRFVAEYLKHRYEHPDGPVMGVLWRSSLDPDVTCCVLVVDKDGCT